MIIECFVSYQINFVCNIIQDVKCIVEMSGTGHAVFITWQRVRFNFLPLMKPNSTVSVSQNTCYMSSFHLEKEKKIRFSVSGQG